MYANQLIGPNERIVLATHPHVMLVVGTIVRSAIGFVIAVSIALFLPRFIPAVPDNLPAIVRLVIAWLPPGLAILAGVSLLLNTVLAYLGWRSREYVVTNGRLLRAEGILNKRSISVPLERVNNLLVQQSIWGRAFNYGNITVLSGNDYAADSFLYVPDVLDFQRAVLDLRSAPQPRPITSPDAPTQPNRIVTPYDQGGQSYR